MPNNKNPKFVVTIVGQDGATHKSKLFGGDKTILDAWTWVKEVQFLLPGSPLITCTEPAPVTIQYVS